MLLHILRYHLAQMVFSLEWVTEICSVYRSDDSGKKIFCQREFLSIFLETPSPCWSLKAVMNEWQCDGPASTRSILELRPIVLALHIGLDRDGRDTHQTPQSLRLFKPFSGNQICQEGYGFYLLYANNTPHVMKISLITALPPYVNPPVCSKNIESIDGQPITQAQYIWEWPLAFPPQCHCRQWE